MPPASSSAVAGRFLGRSPCAELHQRETDRRADCSRDQPAGRESGRRYVSCLIEAQAPIGQLVLVLCGRQEERVVRSV